MSRDMAALDYRPIRAAIRARLVTQDRDWHSVTEMCSLLAALAHEQFDTWCQQLANPLCGQDARGVRAYMAGVWAPEIAAIRQVSALVTASLTAAGWSAAAVEAGLQRKLALEFVLVPHAALN